MIPPFKFEVELSPNACFHDGNKRYKILELWEIAHTWDSYKLYHIENIGWVVCRSWQTMISPPFPTAFEAVAYYELMLHDKEEI